MRGQVWFRKHVSSVDLQQSIQTFPRIYRLPAAANELMIAGLPPDAGSYNCADSRSCGYRHITSLCTNLLRKMGGNADCLTHNDREVL